MKSYVEKTSMPILIDLIMIGLLIGVIIHSIRLAQSLTNFKTLHGEIVPLMKDYAKQVIDTQSQIHELKKISSEVDHMINSRIPPALLVKNDLDFLVSRGNELADHLESIISTGRRTEFAVLKEDIKEKTTKPKTSKKKSSEFQEEEPAQTTTLTAERESKTKKVTMESFFLTKTAQKIMNKGKGNVA